MSVDKYEEFSLKKSISACVIAKSKLKKELKPTEWVEVDISKKDNKSQASIQ